MSKVDTESEMDNVDNIDDDIEIIWDFKHLNLRDQVISTAASSRPLQIPHVRARFGSKFLEKIGLQKQAVQRKGRRKNTKNTATMSVLGFDIGNLNCFIAAARAGGIETVANEQSERCTPAYVSFSESQRFAGAAAKNQVITNAKNTISNFKRLIGRKFDDPYVQHEIPNLPYEVIKQHDGSVGIKVQYLGQDEVFSPEQVLGMLLTTLKGHVEKSMGIKAQDCVISVPSYYTDFQRRALLSATQIAGLNCLRLLNETTAVALSYGLYKKDLPAIEEKPRHVVFVDVGHSACQVSVCAFRKGKIKVMSTTSDPLLGGRDFDNILRDYFGGEFLQKYKLNAKSKIRPWLRLLGECEKMKKLMSANATDLPLSIECFMDDKDVTAKCNRAKLEELSGDLLSRFRVTLQDALQGSGLSKNDIHSVELVGGSTRVPAVKEIIQSVFEKELCTTLNADEAVARGCAIQCAMLSPTFKVRDIDVEDVTPYPIHLSWKDSTKDEIGNMEIFCRNHSFPASKMLTLKRKEPFELYAYYSQDAVIPHTEFDIGRFLIKDVTPSSTGESSKVKVKVRLNIHGILAVTSASMVELLPTPPPSPEPEKRADGPEPMETAQNENAAEPPKENGTNGTDSADNQQSEAKDEPMSTDDTKASTEPPTEGKKEENQPATEQENKGTETKPEVTPKKSKKKKLTTDLSIESYVPELSEKQLNNLIEVENAMIMQEKIEKDRADASNAVESYVYMMREKLSDVYEQYMQPEDREKFLTFLEATEDWLYDEGEGQKKQVYVSKLEELKKIGEPVVERYNCHLGIPSAFDAYGQAFIHFRKILDLYSQKDEKYVHIEEAEMAKVAKKVDEEMQWLNTKMTDFRKTPLHMTPSVTPSLIYSEKKSLESFCNPIVAKPKPKVEPPPKEDKKEQNGGEKKEDGKEKANNEQKEEEQPQQTPQTEGTNTAEKKDLDMEVD
eukprot:Seg353.11 transcript_id=Seg353.11/GoldUCD/mRNA.D3Y31 product="Heat shock protein 105 kDa" protein_id=Seg353.11/GoldUCD/D3Y31